MTAKIIIEKSYMDRQILYEWSDRVELKIRGRKRESEMGRFAANRIVIRDLWKCVEPIDSITLNVFNTINIRISFRVTSGKASKLKLSRLHTILLHIKCLSDWRQVYLLSAYFSDIANNSDWQCQFDFIHDAVDHSRSFAIKGNSKEQTISPLVHKACFVKTFTVDDDLCFSSRTL